MALNLMVGTSKPYLWNGSTAHWCEGQAQGGAYVPPTWNHDYGTQIEFRDIDAYFKALGYPTIIYQGTRYDLKAFADVISITYKTLHLHVSHGAIGYKAIRWGYDLDEYRAKVAVHLAEKEALALAKEEAKDIRRKEVKHKLAFFRVVRESVRKERNRDIKKEVVFIPREPFTGSIRWYLDGVLTQKDKIPQLLDMSLNLMETLIKKGNFTFRGKLVEIRHYIPPVKGKGKPAGRPKGKVDTKNRVTLFDGAPLSTGDIGEKLGMSRAQVKYALSKGAFEKDGHKVEFAKVDGITSFSYRRPRNCIDKMVPIL